MRIFRFLLLLWMLSALFSSCTQKKNSKTHTLLARWDSIQQVTHQDISDSLKTITYITLSEDDKAYYNLLDAACSRQKEQAIASDSVINSVVAYYHKHSRNRENLIRAYIYQGIVRSQIPHSDSTIFESLKAADKLLKKQKEPKNINGFLINFYLGRAHYNRDNLMLAEQYFRKAYEFGKRSNDTTLMAEAQQAIFWNHLKREDVHSAKFQLDTLARYENLNSKTKSEIAKAKAIYYHTTGDYLNALLSEKEQLAEGMIDKSPFEISNIFYNISTRYLHINKLDSAMLYGQIAIDYATDSASKYNYLLYENVADIAERFHNHNLSNLYRKRTLEAYQHTIHERLNTEIIRLEKQYDLSEAENSALRSKQQSLYLTIALLALILLLCVVVRIYRNKERKMELQVIQAEMQAKNQRQEAKIIQEEANKRFWLIKLYGYISERLNVLQNNFENLSQKYIASYPKVYESMNEILNSTENDLREFPKDLIPNDQTFALYTNMATDMMAKFSDNEKVILMLLICKADNKQIATFMNTTMESIRVRKSQLKKKLLDLNIDTAPFFS